MATKEGSSRSISISICIFKLGRGPAESRERGRLHAGSKKKRKHGNKKQNKKVGVKPYNGVPCKKVVLV